MRGLEHFLDAAPDAMVLVGVDGRITHVNRGAEELFGYAREELRGEPVEALIPEAAREQRAAPVGRPVRAGLELRGLRKDGREVPVEVSLRPLEWSEVEGVLMAIRDITERKRAEAKASRLQALLREAAEAQAIAVAAFDAEGNLLAENSAFRALFTRGAGRPRASAEVLEALTRTPPGQEQGVEARSRLRWGGRSLHVSRWWTEDRVLVLSVADRTEDDAREDLLREALEAKNAFLAQMSHELRTPLNAILGFARLLEREPQAPLSGRQREMVSHICSGGQHLLRLVDEALDLARVDAGRIDLTVEAVDLGERVGEVVATLEPLYTARGISITVAPVVASVPAVRADATRVTQILMNLLSNAIKYGHEGGRVVVGAASLDGARVRVTVEDDGAGIPFEKQRLLFQPFQRAGQERGKVEGSGIGLALSRRLASLMGGQVDFESVPGRGSTFWLDLPAQG